MASKAVNEAKAEATEQAQQELRGNMVAEVGAMRERAERAEAELAALQKCSNSEYEDLASADLAAHETMVNELVGENTDLRGVLRHVRQDRDRVRMLNATLHEQLLDAQSERDKLRDENYSWLQRNSELVDGLNQVRDAHLEIHEDYERAAREAAEYYNGRIEEQRHKYDNLLHSRSAVIEQLTKTEDAYRRLGEYASAAIQTLNTERRYGPHMGAPGTEHILDSTTYYGTRVVEYPVRADSTPAEVETQHTNFCRYDPPVAGCPGAQGCGCTGPYEPAPCPDPEYCGCQSTNGMGGSAQTDELRFEPREYVLDNEGNVQAPMPHQFASRDEYRVYMQLTHHLDMHAQPREQLWAGLRRPNFG